MDPSIGTKLYNLSSQGHRLLNGLAAEIQAMNAPGPAVGRQLVAEGAGQLASELFGTRRARSPGKKLIHGWLVAEKRKAEQQITSKYYQHYRAWLNEVVLFLSQISLVTPRLKATGNSLMLVNKVKRAEGFKKLDTRIRHVLTQLEELRIQELVWNAALPKQLPKPEPALEIVPHDALRNLENLLRQCIERELSALTADWWKERVPAEVRGRVENRKHRRETVWPWYPATASSVVDYLDFSDYRKIIFDPTTWAACFSKLFKAQSFIEARLGELEPIRNDIAHSREIGKVAQDKLRIYCEELKACIGGSRG